MTDRNETQLNRIGPDGLKEMLAEHIVYEVDMMRGTYACLTSGGHSWFSITVVNALHESFCVHARVLNEFFTTDDRPADNTAGARHFAKPEYTPFPQGAPSGELIGKLNKQISHPSYGRTLKDKLGPDDRERLMRFIDDEVVNFSRHLRTTYAPIWPDRMRQARATPLAIPAGSTNAISAARSAQATAPANPVVSTSPYGTASISRTITD